jgi:glycosyltransferase involved in cell wall biosynthesis
MSQLFVNARFLTQNLVGVQRTATEVAKRLKVLRPETRFLTPEGVLFPELAAVLEAEVVGKHTGHLWEQLELPRLTRGSGLLSLTNTGPIFHPQQVVILHDASPFAVPEAYSLAFRSWYRVLFAGLKHRAKGLITVSEFSRRELERYCGIPRARLEVVGNGREHVFSAEADMGILNQHDLKGPYLLAVGSNSPHKNFARLLGALTRLGETPFRVVIAGGSNARVHGEGLVLPKSVTHVGYVSDGELRALYEHATAFIHPAYYEGFGIPPLEAMTLGCPVLVSNAASLPEVCGVAALYFDPFSETDIAGKIAELMQDTDLQTRLRAAGKVQAARFSWDHCAHKVLRITESTLEL